MNVIELLEKTQNLLRNPENWCKGHYSVAVPRSDGTDGIQLQHCTLGALTQFDSDGQLTSKAVAYLYATYNGGTKLEPVVKLGHSSMVARHNDNMRTTHKDLKNIPA